MTLGHAISNAYSGLVASSRQAEVTSNNIANVETEGYARRSLEQSARAIGGRGYGVRVDGVRVAVAENLTAERRRADAAAGGQQVTAEATRSLERMIGGPDDPASLFGRVEAVEAGFRALSNDPSATHLQLDLNDKASDLVSAFHEMEESTLAMRQSLDTEIGRTVTRLNEVLAEIHALNNDARREANLGTDTGETRARRDTLIDEISDIIPIKTIQRDTGIVAVMTDTGYALVDGSVAEFGFSTAPVITADMDLIGGAPGALSGLTLEGADVTPPATEPATIVSGKLYALFQARDVETVAFQERIDALADDLVARFSDAAVDPTLAGAVGLFTDAGAASTGDPGAAGRLALNAAVDPAQGGEIWRYRDGVGATVEGDVGANAQTVRFLGALTDPRAAPAGSGVSGSKSAVELAAAVGSLLASRAESAEGTLALRNARLQTLTESEGRAVGVDLDAELQDLETLQTAYAANARVMEVVNSLFRTLLEI